MTKLYNIPIRLWLLVLIISTGPFLLSLFGVDFSMEHNSMGTARLSNIVLNATTVTIAILTVMLCFIDFYVSKQVSSPILGISLLCASFIDIAALLYQSNLVRTDAVDQPVEEINNFVWLFSRTFHASAILLGVSIFTSSSDKIKKEVETHANQFVGYISTILLLLTSLVVVILVTNDYFPPLRFPDLPISRPFDLLPLLLYLIAGLYFMPRFDEKYPSVFSQALMLCLIPSALAQLHLSFGSKLTYDSDYMIAQFLRVFSYFIPFAGVAFNYYAVVQNERRVIVNLNREAEQRKQAEDTLFSVLNSSPSGIIAYRSVRDVSGEIIDFRVVIFNKAVLQLHNSPAYWEGKKMSEVFPGNFRNGLFERFRDVAISGISLETEFYSDTYGRWYNISASKRFDGITVVFNDINALKEYEAELKNSIANLDRSNKELEQFAYIASHDLQEPLRKIRAFGQRIGDNLRSTLDEKNADYLQRMTSASDRMYALIEDLLLYSRISTRNNATTPVNLNEVIKGVISDFEYTIEQTKAAITIDTLPSLKANSLKIQQLFHNLLSNALKFSVKDVPPEIRIAYSTVQHPIVYGEQLYGTFHRISFSDNGIGFDSVYREKIFDIFQRLHTRDAYIGSGIGLAICKKIVEQLNGYIYAESTEGKGATFTILIPADYGKQTY